MNSLTSRISPRIKYSRILIVIRIPQDGRADEDEALAFTQQAASSPSRVHGPSSPSLSPTLSPSLSDCAESLSRTLAEEEAEEEEALALTQQAAS